MWSTASQQSINPRQVSSSECYDVCNNAILEAENSGKSSSLCTSDSVYFANYTTCLACLQEHPSDELSRSLDNSFAQFNDYCESFGIAVPEAITTTVVATLDNRIVTIPITTVLGYASGTPSPDLTTPSNLSSTTPSAHRTSFSSTLINPIASPTDTSSSESSHSQNRAWIAGAAVGSIAGVLFVAALPGFLWYYRRRRQRHKLQSPFEKAQLHSDCIPRQELEGTQISELEAPVAELKGTEQLPELPDTDK
ncbi:hypothetical protein F4680DRAFT_421387 [Xylaria scruposa]|nr:hypothetical protein F4680DRAFT_421387 [Xylaria scruposa]